MTMFWTIWISVISLGTIAGCWLGLRWVLSNSTGVAEGESMGHEFDGITELNNQLPKWWTKMFYITMIWGVLYLLAYPGLGAYKGLLNWESSNQGILSLAESRAELIKDIAEDNLNEYAITVKLAQERFDPIFAEYAKTPVEQLVLNEEAVQVGKRLFLQNCAQCHGSDARGQRGGFPNLTDKDWLYGGSGDKIKETLVNGRRGNMPGWLASFGEKGIEEIVAYTLSLSGRRDIDLSLVDAGKARFVVCAACHSMNAKGNQIIGAPNLTDNVWLYGGSERAVTETLNYGRNGVMPAFDKTLGKDKIHVVATYVYSLSN